MPFLRALTWLGPSSSILPRACSLFHSVQSDFEEDASFSSSAFSCTSCLSLTVDAKERVHHGVKVGCKIKRIKTQAIDDTLARNGRHHFGELDPPGEVSVGEVQGQLEARHLLGGVQEEERVQLLHSTQGLPLG